MIAFPLCLFRIGLPANCAKYAKHISGSRVLSEDHVRFVSPTGAINDVVAVASNSLFSVFRVIRGHLSSLIRRRDVFGDALDVGAD